MATGDISGIVASYEFDNVQGVHPSVLHIAGNIYAVAYRGPGNDGWLQTLSISADGTVVAAVDSLEFDTTECANPHLIPISGNVYAIAYAGPGSDGWLVTVEITPAGVIAAIDSLEFETTYAEHPCLVPLGGTVYAVAYGGPPQVAGHLLGWLKTLNIPSNGVGPSIIRSFNAFGGHWEKVDDAVPDEATSYVKNATAGAGVPQRDLYEPEEITAPSAITGVTVYARTRHNGGGMRCCLRTHGVVYEGALHAAGAWTTWSEPWANNPFTGAAWTQAELDDLEIGVVLLGTAFVPDWSDCTQVYAQVTFAADPAQIIRPIGPGSETNIDSQVPDDGSGQRLKVTNISGNVYAVAYREDSTNEGWVQTLLIPSDGSTLTRIGRLQFDVYSFLSSFIFNVSGNVYAISYRGPGDDGWTVTLTISDDGATLATIAYLEWEGAQAAGVNMKYLYQGRRWFVVVYWFGAAAFGTAVTLEVAADGSTITELDRANFGVAALTDGVIDLIHVAGDIFSVFYSDGGDDGWLDTYEIEAGVIPIVETLAATGVT